MNPHLVYAGGGFPFSTTGSYENPNGVIQLLSLPSDAVYDSLGNAYIANSRKNQILKIDSLLNVTVFAGSSEGSSGYIDGTGANARFNLPTGLAIDPADNLYVTDVGNFRVRKITSGGAVTTIAGGQIGIIDGTGITAGFHTMSGIAYDSGSTDLFVLDYHKVRRVTQAGVVTTFTGSPYATLTNSGNELYSFTHLGYLFNIIDNRTIIFTGQPVEGSQGNVARAYYASPAGVLTEVPALQAAISGFLQTPKKVGTIRTYYELGIPKYLLFGFNAGTQFFSVSEGDSPNVALGNTSRTLVDGQGNLASFENPAGIVRYEGPTNSETDDIYYVTDKNTIRKIVLYPIPEVITLAGSPTAAGDATGPGPISLFSNPTELAVNPSNGDVYICDTGNNKIKKMQSNGFVSNFIGTGVAGNIDGPRLSADIYQPRDIVFHPNGKLYFWSQYCLKECDVVLGIVSTVAGDFYQQGFDDLTGTNARFTNPEKMIINQDGDFLLYDMSASPYGTQHRVRKITISGFNVSTFIGIYPSQVVDGTSATTKIGYSTGIAIDSTGQIFITDEGPFGGYVRKIDNAGNTTLFAGGEPSNVADGIGPLAGFSRPRGMRIDSSDNLFLTDRGSVIRQVDPMASVTTFAGTVEGNADGPIASALFEQLQGIGINPVNGDFLVTQFGYAYASSPAARLISGGNVTTIPTTGIGPVVVTPPQANLTLSPLVTVPLGPDVFDSDSPSVAMCCFKAPASEAISMYDVVYLNQGTIQKLDAPTLAVRPFLIGIARNSASIGEDVYLQYQGIFPQDDIPPFPLVGGGTIYYAGAAGALTTIPPVSGYRAEILRIGNSVNLAPVFLGDSHIEFDLSGNMPSLQAGMWTFSIPPLTITVPKPWIQVIGGYANGSQTIWMDWTQYFEINWGITYLQISWTGDNALHKARTHRINFGKVVVANFTMPP